ncbi:hypothetical protein KOI35_39055 [Actinoplanes bogorensis]|uniref:Uncharacterized protein n=1 Tax=Paractinoplanes bogorensis TaxID=1610840 RepID=A0ABS5Z1Y3_9ACTN|nr:hypothetical protein [Actinoplanes bogorensis]
MEKTELPVRRAGAHTGEQRGVGGAGGQRRGGGAKAPEASAVSDSGAFRRVADPSDSGRAADSGEFRRLSDPGPFDRVPDPDSFGRAPDNGSFERSGAFRPVSDTGSFGRVSEVGSSTRGADSGSSTRGADSGSSTRGADSGSFARADDSGSFARADDSGSFARADSGSFARVSETGEFRWGASGAPETRKPETRPAESRGADTGEFRRFLDASDRAAERPEAKEQRRPVPVGEAPRQSRAVTVGIVLLSIVVLVAGGIVGVAYFTGTDDRLDSVLQLGAGESAPRAVTAPLDNRNQASFEVLAATNRVNVTIGELGDDLYRISTPDDAGFLPDPVIRGDDVKLQVTKDGDGTGGEINIVLAAKVRWALRFSGYAEEQAIDLSGGQISGLEMVGGMRTARISLARPTGTVPIKVNGAVERLVVNSPSGSPVRVTVNGGAKTVVAGSRTIKDVAPGSTLTPKNWAVQNRYDIGAGAPITTLTVENA